MRVLLICCVLALAACGSVATDQPGTPEPASIGTATTDCTTLAAIAPAPVPPLTTVDLGNGTKRVTSAEGGYSLAVPAAWRVSGSNAGTTNPWFAQAHMSSYDPAAVPSLVPEAGSIVPPEVGIRFDVEMWANPLNESADAFAQRIHIGPDQTTIVPGGYVSLGATRAYRMTIRDERRFQPTSGPLVITRQTRIVWIVQSPKPDRYLVFYATPGESPLLALVERAMSTLQITAPRSATMPVTYQRSDILNKWTIGKSGPISGRRVEAKLVTYAEAEAAMNARPGAPSGGPIPIQLLRIDRDLDELFWVVAVSGPDLPRGRGSPAGTSPPTAWILYETPATNDDLQRTGTQFASAGTWPPGFDALPDRCV